MEVFGRLLIPEIAVVGHRKRLRGSWVSADAICLQTGGTRNKMKKTTQTLLTVVGVFLLLVIVTASPRARSNPNPAPPVQYYGHGAQIRWKKEMGLIPIGPGSNQASTNACSAFFIYAVDPDDNKCDTFVLSLPLFIRDAKQDLSRRAEHDAGVSLGG
jgi:hypothetical protein